VPTGLGKTSVIAIWLLARSVQASLPTRLVYVVNRRTVVDQTTAEVERLRMNLADPRMAGLRTRLALPDDTMLSISTLRGQFNDNRQWLEEPSLPSVVVGTVDMVGSRLLFNGYRTGRWQKARHAGMLGQDSLLVHDEAHLEPAFQRLLDWIEARQQTDGSPRPLRVMAMSATGSRPISQAVSVFTTADEAHPVVRKRFSEVKKQLFLHDLSGKTKAVDRIVALAAQHEKSPSRVLVYVRRPEDASRVFQ
jgi:CRISPR-associated endonuclease/helicase Cas3